MHLPTSRLLSTVILLFIVISLFAKTDKYRCMWRDDPATTMTIGWNQISGHSPTLYFSEVDYGQDVSAYTQLAKPDRKVLAKGMHNHFVRLTGLYPGTVYYFVIADSEGLSQRMSFRTAPDHPHERLSIIAGGDSRNHRTGRRNANKLVSKLRPHCVMFGGDMTGSDRSREWKAWFDDWQHTFSNDGRITPLIATRGNHEYSNKTLVDLFDVRNEKVYYALNLGGSLLRVYTLNSLIASGGNQKYWLEQDLADHQHMIWKVAQYHYAIRPHTRSKKERNDQYRNWAKAFHQFQVNMVVESDAHVVKTTWPVSPSSQAGNDEGFIRDDDFGTVYIGEGCWGAPLRRNNDNKNWTRDSGSFNQFKWIFVDQDGIEVRTIKTDNADMVGEVDPYDIYTPPAGISIWQPKNGSVIVIPRRSPSIAQSATASLEEMIPFENTFPSAPSKSSASSVSASLKANKKVNSTPVEVTECVASLSDADITIEWKTKYETDRKIKYELQKTIDGKNFKTIAQIKSTGITSNKTNIYKIKDQFTGVNELDLGYRIKKISLRGQASYHKVKNVEKVYAQWRQFEEIKANPDSGLIKARYELKQQSDVSVKLLTYNQEEVTKNIYKKQKPGNYQQSINMKHVTPGAYLLLIEINNEVKHRYHVKN